MNEIVTESTRAQSECAGYCRLSYRVPTTGENHRLFLEMLSFRKCLAKTRVVDPFIKNF